MKLNLARWSNSEVIHIPKIILKKKQEKIKFELLAEQSKGEKSNPKLDIDWGDPIGKEVW